TAATAAPLTARAAAYAPVGYHRTRVGRRRTIGTSISSARRTAATAPASIRSSPSASAVIATRFRGISSAEIDRSAYPMPEAGEVGSCRPSDTGLLLRTDGRGAVLGLL